MAGNGDDATVGPARRGVCERRQLARVYTTALCSRRPHRAVSSRLEPRERFYLFGHLARSLSPTRRSPCALFLSLVHLCPLLAKTTLPPFFLRLPFGLSPFTHLRPRHLRQLGIIDTRRYILFDILYIFGYVSFFFLIQNRLHFRGACRVPSSACIDVSKRRATLIKTCRLDISFVERELPSCVVITVGL